MGSTSVGRQSATCGLGVDGRSNRRWNIICMSYLDVQRLSHSAKHDVEFLERDFDQVVPAYINEVSELSQYQQYTRPTHHIVHA
mgnify:CR=1 FL=1